MTLLVTSKFFHQEIRSFSVPILPVHVVNQGTMKILCSIQNNQAPGVKVTSLNSQFLTFQKSKTSDEVSKVLDPVSKDSVSLSVTLALTKRL